MTSVLLQDHGNKLRPVAYFSSKLDPVVAGLQRYIQMCGGSKRQLWPPEILHIYKRLLEMSNTTVKHPVLKPATLLPTR